MKCLSKDIALVNQCRLGTPSESQVYNASHPSSFLPTFLQTKIRTYNMIRKFLLPLHIDYMNERYPYTIYPILCLKRPIPFRTSTVAFIFHILMIRINFVPVVLNFDPTALAIQQSDLQHF